MDIDERACLLCDGIPLDVIFPQWWLSDLHPGPFLTEGGELTI